MANVPITVAQIQILPLWFHLHQYSKNLPLVSQQHIQTTFIKIASKIHKTFKNEAEFFQLFNDVFSFLVGRIEAVKINFENSAKSNGVKIECPYNKLPLRPIYTVTKAN